MKLTTFTTLLVLLLLTVSVPAEAGKGGKGGGNTPTGYTGSLYLHAGGIMDESAPTAVVPETVTAGAASSWASDTVNFGNQPITVTWWDLSTPGLPNLDSRVIGYSDWYVRLYQTSSSGETVLAWNFATIGASAGQTHTLSLQTSAAATPSTSGDVTLRLAIEPYFTGPVANFGVREILYDAVDFRSCVVIGTGNC